MNKTEAYADYFRILLIKRIPLLRGYRWNKEVNLQFHIKRQSSNNNNPNTITIEAELNNQTAKVHSASRC